MNLLTRGNDKIGGRVWAFNLPAVTTCPGMTASCEVCYARRSRWLFRGVQEALAWNFRACQRAFFIEEICEELRRRRVKTLRLHASGDFFSEVYTRRWAEILVRNPQVRAYAYTRSWRVPEIRPALDDLAVLPNFRMWYSADRSCEMPDNLPTGVRIAWLQESEDDPIPAGIDLIFRVHRLRRTVRKRIGLTLVCPTEQGREHSKTCTDCKLCWR